MKQAYTVKMEKRVFLYNRGSEAICPKTVTVNNIRHCGDWCPMFEVTIGDLDNPAYGTVYGEVTLHCCNRVIPVEVEE